METVKNKPKPSSKENEASAKTKTEKTKVENKDPVTGQFVLGKPSLGGRPKGSRALLAQQFIENLKDSWNLNGVAALQKLYETDVGKYVATVAAILPKQITGEDGEPIRVEHTAGLSSLEASLDAIRAKELARAAAAESDEG